MRGWMHVPNHSVVVRFRQVFKLGPLLAVLVDLCLPPPGHLSKKLRTIDAHDAPVKCSRQLLAGFTRSGAAAAKTLACVATNSMALVISAAPHWITSSVARAWITGM